MTASMSIAVLVAAGVVAVGCGSSSDTCATARTCNGTAATANSGGAASGASGAAPPGAPVAGAPDGSPTTPAAGSGAAAGGVGGHGPIVGLGGAESGGDSGAAGASGGANGETAYALFVDPISGTDGGSCRGNEPCRTLSFALTLAKAPDTIYLEPGNYSAGTGETFKEPVPAGVTIESKVAGQAVLLASAQDQSTALVIPAGATLRYLRISGFNSGVRVDGGSATLDGLEFTDVEYPVWFRGTSKVTMSGGSISKAFYAIQLADSATAALSDITIVDSGGGISCGYTGRIVDTRGSASVTLERIRGSSLKGYLRFDDDTQVTIKNSSFAGVTDPECQPGLSSDTSKGTLIDSVIFENFELVGLRDADVKGCQFKSSRISTSGNVKIAGSSVSGANSLDIGISPSGTLSLDDVFVRGFKVGLSIDGGYKAQVKVRASQFIYNDVGVSFYGGADTGVDLGTAADAGKNELSGNATWGLHVTGTVDKAAFASGNTWESDTQGSDGAGHMQVGVQIKGPYVDAGKNFRIDSAGPSIKF